MPRPAPEILLQSLSLAAVLAAACERPLSTVPPPRVDEERATVRPGAGS
jgi:hypothetical protein